MFNWLDKLLIKVAKKILNSYAPKCEFIAYINKQEEKLLKDLGGLGKPVNQTGIKSFWNPFSWAAEVIAPVVKFVAPYVKFYKNIVVVFQLYQ